MGRNLQRRLSRKLPGGLAACGIGLMLWGCATGPELADLRQPPSPHLSPEAPPGVTDGRAAFRHRFCQALAARDAGAAGLDCESWLHRMDDEPAEARGVSAAMPVALEVLLVTGAFSECFGEHARPFHSASKELEGGSFRFSTVVVGGRSGAEHNAAQIAAYFDEHPPEAGRELVMIGYSKGTTDILQFLVDYPAQAEAVDAVVSVAGAVYGSPLADFFDGPYHLLFSHLPMNLCGKGDSGVVHSLRTDLRRQWLEDNALPGNTRYYSLAAFTTRDRLARSLLPSWEMLLGHGDRNDGQLLPADAIIPGSTVLGYLNADHWAVAMEIEKELEFWAHREFTAAFPHAALLHAILDQVGADLAGSRATVVGPGSETE
jgi:hypothetical protein